MRKLVFMVLIFAAAYGGYWFAGSRALLAGVQAVLADLQAQGRMTHQGVSLRGFPSRFDLTLDEPALMADGLAWSAPFVQVFALSYRPNRIIAVWPHQQTLAVAGQVIALENRDMRASAAFGAQAALPFDHAQLVVTAPVAASDLGWRLAADVLRLAAQVQDDPRVQRIGAEALSITLDGLDPALPRTLDRAHLDATVTIDAPLDRHLAAPPRPVAVEIATASLAAGHLALDAQGRVDIAPDGSLAGRIEVTAQGWRAMLAMARDTGLLPAQEAANLERMLDGLARAGADPDRVTLPFTLDAGRVYLGAFPLGAAPRL